MYVGNQWTDHHDVTWQKKVECFVVMKWDFFELGNVDGRRMVSALHQLAQLAKPSVSFLIIILIQILLITTSSLHQETTKRKTNTAPPDTTKNVTTIGPAEKSRWAIGSGRGTMYVVHQQAIPNGSVIARCHPLALACQPGCQCASALHRGVFSRGICPEYPQTKGLKRRGQPSRCNLSTLIVCSLLQTTLPAATCN